MLSEYETKILELFRKRLFGWLSISEINKALKKGTYKSTYFNILSLQKKACCSQKRGAIQYSAASALNQCRQ